MIIQNKTFPWNTKYNKNKKSVYFALLCGVDAAVTSYTCCLFVSSGEKCRCIWTEWHLTVITAACFGSFTSALWKFQFHSKFSYSYNEANVRIRTYCSEEFLNSVLFVYNYIHSVALHENVFVFVYVTHSIAYSDAIHIQNIFHL